MPVTIDPTEVVRSTEALPFQRNAIEDVVIGQALSVDLETGGAKIADKDTEVDSRVLGISLATVFIGNPCVIQYFGDIVLGATAALTPGGIYVVGSAGLIMLSSELVTGDWVTIVGIAKSATTLRLAPYVAGIQVE